jgi:predicted acetyltransferase
MTKKASHSLGIIDYRRVIQQEPFTMEWEFKLSKAAGLAYSKARKNSFERWVEDFNDKLEAFDKVEQVVNGVDYFVVWEDRTL